MCVCKTLCPWQGNLEWQEHGQAYNAANAGDFWDSLAVGICKPNMYTIHCIAQKLTQYQCLVADRHTDRPTKRLINLKQHGPNHTFKRNNHLIFENRNKSVDLLEICARQAETGTET